MNCSTRCGKRGSCRRSRPLLCVHLIQSFLERVKDTTYATRLSLPQSDLLLPDFRCSAIAVSLRMQVDPQSTEFKSLLLERAYADALLCGLLLFLIVWNFMG